MRGVERERERGRVTERERERERHSYRERERETPSFRLQRGRERLHPFFYRERYLFL